MISRYLVLVLTAVFLAWNVSPVFAEGTAVVLSDAELDQIYAQGFNFSEFNDFLGDFGSVFMSPGLNFRVDGNRGGTLTFSGQSGEQPIFSTGSGDINYINLQDYAQQFASNLVNVNAAGSNVLVGLNLNIIIDSNVGDLISNNILSILTPPAAPTPVTPVTPITAAKPSN